MVALSIKLPEELAEASKNIAEKLGVSRTELIRIALAHELESIKAKWEREQMIKSFSAMKSHASYQAEVERFDQELPEEIPAEGDKWWMG